MKNKVTQTDEDWLEDKKQSNVADSAALSANSEMLGRYSEAGKQFKVAYDGIDNETGQKLHQGLKDIGKYKETSVGKDGSVIDNTRTQQGYAAEVLDTAKQNTENIKKGKSERVARTDDVVDPNTGKKRVNDPKHDQVALDAAGNVIAGSGVQMKFCDPESFVDFIAGRKRAKHGTLWADKYPDGKFRVPSDQYEEIKRRLKEELENIRKEDVLSAEQVERCNYIMEVDRNLQKSAVSKREAIEARKHPGKTTAKEIAKTSHEAGFEAAKVGAALVGGISLLKNTFAVLMHVKEAKEAVADTAKDTAAAGGTSYAVGFANTALASVMKNSSNAMMRSLGKTNAPAYIIQTAIDTTKSLVRLCEGKVTVDDFFHEIGRNGTVMLASAQGAAVGQLLIPVPLFGAMIGASVSAFLCGVIYDNTIAMKALNAEIDAFCYKLGEEISWLKEYHAGLLSSIDKFKLETSRYGVMEDFFKGGYSEDDFNAMLKLTYECAGIPCPWGAGSFEEFMSDKSRALKYE